MKLRKLYSYIYFLEDVRVYVDAEEKPAFEGAVGNIPIYLADYKVDKDSLSIERENTPNGKLYLAITVKEE